MRGWMDLNASKLLNPALLYNDAILSPQILEQLIIYILTTDNSNIWICYYVPHYVCVSQSNHNQAEFSKRNFFNKPVFFCVIFKRSSSKVTTLLQIDLANPYLMAMLYKNIHTNTIYFHFVYMSNKSNICLYKLFLSPQNQIVAINIGSEGSRRKNLISSNWGNL